MAAPWEAPDGSGVDVNHPYGPGSTPSSTAALRCDLGRAINPPPTHQAANKAGKGSAASARGEQPGPGACTERRRRKRANKGERGCAPSSASCGSVRAQHLVLQGLRAKGGQGAEVLPALQRRAQFPSALQRGAVLSPALPIARCAIPSCPIALSCIPPLPYRGELKSCPVLQRGAPGLSCLGSCVALKEKSGILCHHCRPLRGLFPHISPAPHRVGITERFGLESQNGLGCKAQQKATSSQAQLAPGAAGFHQSPPLYFPRASVGPSEGLLALWPAFLSLGMQCSWAWRGWSSKGGDGPWGGGGGPWSSPRQSCAPRHQSNGSLAGWAETRRSLAES